MHLIFVPSTIAQLLTLHLKFLLLVVLNFSFVTMEIPTLSLTTPEEQIVTQKQNAKDMGYVMVTLFVCIVLRILDNNIFQSNYKVQNYLMWKFLLEN